MSEVFEICDFTSASHWERFVSQLEEIFTQWTKQCPNSTRTLSAREITCGKWRQMSESVRFAKTHFSLLFHTFLSTDEVMKEENQLNQSDVLNDMMAEEHDFPAKSHHLVRWYGLRHFIVLSATEDSIGTEDRTQLLLSSASMALNNAKSHLPVFCQLGSDGQRRLYSGVALNESRRTHFQMIHLNHIPNRLRHLAPLVALFRDKLYSTSASYSSTSSPILLSIRFTYSIDEWPQEEEEEDKEEEEEVLVSRADEHMDPLLSLHLSVTWPSLFEEVVTDSDVHSDLEPNNGENWSLRAIFSNHSSSSLSRSLSQLLSEKENRVLSQIHENDNQFKEVFNPILLHSSSSSLSSSSHWNRQKWAKEQTIGHIFGDDKKWTQEEEDEEEEILRRALKSAPKGSLSHRMATTLANAYIRSKDWTDVALLWREVVSHLRHCWESSSLLPFMSSGAPDLNTCLLHQKLQMFYKCLQQKRERENNNREESDGEEEEFYDCAEETERTEGEGRLERLGDLMLLAEEEYLFVPKTQSIPPMTEDMVEEQMAVLSRLGTNKESQSVRARMQTKSLLSDMEAFKAANPRALFEDFVRWHSPRDWIQTDDNNGGRNGALSPRFRAPGNMWREVWDGAEAVPRERQKRLFDERTEAEKILHFFSSLTSHEFIELIFPLLMHTLVQQLNEKLKDLNFEHKFIVEKHVKREELLKGLEEKETQIKRFESLFRKFAKSNETLETNARLSEEQIRKCALTLIAEPEVQFSSFEPLAQLLRQMFYENQLFLYEKQTTVGERDSTSASSLATFGDPIAKEFIIRCRSASMLQRMYCLLSEKEFRICSAFSEDLTYFY